MAFAGLAAACSGEVTGLIPDGSEPAGLDAAVPATDGSLAGVDATIADSGAAAGADAAMPGPDAASPGPDASTGLSDAGPSSSRQTARPLGSTSAPNGFYEYLPPGYADGVPRPLLVFWHGIGEDGNGTTDLGKVVSNGPPMLIAQNKWPGDRPFVVLSPQHGPSGCPSRDEVQKFIAWALTGYRIDPKRAYLTGLSCGAIGSWDYLGTYRATQVAAAVLVAGDPQDPNQSWSAWGRAGCNLGEVAIWALHGDQDSIVRYENEQATMTRLLACPVPPRRTTRWDVIAGGSHYIWGPIYDGSSGFDIYGWLLANPLP